MQWRRRITVREKQLYQPVNVNTHKYHTAMYTHYSKPARWTLTEIELLTRVYATATAGELISLFPKRNLSSIYRKASSMRLRRSNPNEWSDKELDILTKLYPIMPARQVMGYLPGRSLLAIYQKARNLCLSAYDNSETDVIIRSSFGSCSLSEIARRLGCSCSSVHYRAQVLGLI